MTLTEFLLARITEDEAEARELSRHVERWRREFELNGADGTQGSIVVSLIAGSPSDPDRVMADCATKRLLIDIAFENAATIDGEWACCHSADQIRSGVCESTGVEAAGMILKPLALPYVDHPEFNLAWRTTPM